jgi:hypothetical protein
LLRNNGGKRFKNTFIVKMEKNDSNVSGEHKMFPENESLTPYLEEMTPENNGLSPEENSDSSTKAEHLRRQRRHRRHFEETGGGM